MTIDFLQGDVREVLKTLPNDHFDCVVTSPPYFNLRSYLPDEHENKSKEIGRELTLDEYIKNMVGICREIRRVMKPTGCFWLNVGDFYKEKQLMMLPNRLAIALQEPYYKGNIKNELDRVWLAAMVDGEGCLFIHKRKAGSSSYNSYVKEDGTKNDYLRINDTYSPVLVVVNTSYEIVKKCQNITGVGTIRTIKPEKSHHKIKYDWRVSSNQCKSVVEEIYPYLVAKQHQARLILGILNEKTHIGLIDLHHDRKCEIDFVPPTSLFEKGWNIRSEIVWTKPSAMPESVTDRPTQAHEKIWLLTKSPKYYYDFYGVVEHLRSSPKPRGQKLDDSRGDGPRRNEIWGAENPYRNLRNVWSISPKGYEGAHFATFPPALVERCIRAGSSAYGCCPNCGTPWARVIEKGESLKEWKESCGADSHGGYNGVAQKDYAAHGVQDASAVKARILAGMVEKRTTGWRQTCKCDSDRIVPARVLDPFGGSGTTGLVADILGRDATLIELNPEYIEMAKERVRYEDRKDLLGSKEVEFLEERATLF